MIMMSIDNIILRSTKSLTAKVKSQLSSLLLIGMIVLLFSYLAYNCILMSTINSDVNIASHELKSYIEITIYLITLLFILMNIFFELSLKG